MSDIVVSVESLSKRYDLGEVKDYRLLGDILFSRSRRKRKKALETVEDPRLAQLILDDPVAADAALLERPADTETAAFDAPVPASAQDYDPTKVLWALKDVSFEVPHGEIMGIIGRNGAGKSTLLKIISKITEPTEGRIRISGRVGSLLEIGTGFHPELTGRENVFLNGAIIGMSKREIAERFDEIVEFSEIGRFIDTPVKRYSSGMFTRLAFAVSSHLDTEILIIDEVLSVGDAAFQKKCLKKMTSLMKSGKTVLFVSHSMGTVAELCTHAVLLQEGHVVTAGQTDKVVSDYMRTLNQQPSVSQIEVSAPGIASILEVKVSDSAGEIRSTFDLSEEILIHITYSLSETIYGLQVHTVLTRNATELFTSYDTDGLPVRIFDRGPGLFTSTLAIPKKFLKAGIYRVEAGISTKTAWYQLVEDAAQFDVVEVSETGLDRGYRKEGRGCVVCPGNWEIRCQTPNIVS